MRQNFILPGLIIASLVAPLAVIAQTITNATPTTLFDGRTFKGWEGETNKTWRLEDGALVGGSLALTVPRNEFLSTTRSYTNFVLRVKFKLIGAGGQMNAGVQIRSERATNPTNEMVGYQCDLGDGWWGALYDESRRNKALVQPDEATTKKALKPGDWNEYVIRCEGKRIRSWINDVPMVDYTEPDDAIPQHGRIGLQIHGGGKAEARYKDITIEELPNAAALPRTDAKGNALRRAPTGHVSNYDESKIPAYTLPDPLVLQNGQSVRDADTWFKLRRPEIVKLYETEIYGRIPERAPKVTFAVVETDTKALDGAAVRKHVVGRFGETTNAPAMNIFVYTPAKAAGPVPLVLSLSFFGGGPAPASRGVATNAPATGALRGPGRGEPIAEILARGYGYAVLRYTEIQPDSAAGRTAGVVGLALAPGQTAPAPDEWGAISAWAWGLSRVQDYLETDRAVDARRVAIVGHSRLGKTVLWAGAKDTRFAMVFSSQGGEMGSALARRDYGESLDDMAANFGYQFAGNFQKYSAHWNDMPVDSHMLIALSAPRPVLITGGSGDQWSDPHGEFLGAVAAGHVYRLLGEPDLGTTARPPLDAPVMTGKLAFLEHDGPHAITPLDWKVFLDFADKHLRPMP